MLMTPIRWLVQSMEDAPDVTEAWLGAQETARLAGLTLSKRRRDWLLGRWTAKRLLQSVLAEEEQAPLPLTSIAIDNDPDGAPFAARAEGDHLWRLPVSLSISHSHGVALCAAADLRWTPSVTVGADIEFVEPRARSFVHDFFAPEEIELLARVEGEDGEQKSGFLEKPDFYWTDYDGLATAIWSGKEAALKALRTGLRVDTRAVICLIEPPLHMNNDWTPFAIRFAERPALAAAREAAWSGWWRRMEAWPGFVMTMVARED